MRLFFTAWLLFAIQTLKSQNRVTILIDSMPEPAAHDTVFIAGGFNNWEPGNKNFSFDNRQLVLNVPAGTIEYKFTKGNWQKVECAINGAAIDNRVLNVRKDTTIHIVIQAWQDNLAKKEVVHTASKNVHIIDTAFYIPQLKRSRRIWIYLPEDYHAQTDRRFPVLYMHDGQDLFDVATGFAGEWGIDEFLDTINIKLSQCIVVGVDHGGDHRLTEYNPYDSEQFGKGQGGLYLDFLVYTLKPFIDDKYRTLTGASHSFMAGSSMGGLISMYAAMQYPKVFGKDRGIFSCILGG